MKRCVRVPKDLTQACSYQLSSSFFPLTSIAVASQGLCLGESGQTKHKMASLGLIPDQDEYVSHKIMFQLSNAACHAKRVAVRNPTTTECLTLLSFLDIAALP